MLLKSIVIFFLYGLNLVSSSSLSEGEVERVFLRSLQVAYISADEFAFEDVASSSSARAKHRCAIINVSTLFDGDSFKDFFKAGDERLLNYFKGADRVYNFNCGGLSFTMLNHIKFSSRGGKPHYTDDVYTNAWLEKGLNSYHLALSVDISPDLVLRTTSVYRPGIGIYIYMFDNTYERLVRNTKMLSDIFSQCAQKKEETESKAVSEEDVTVVDQMSELITKILKISASATSTLKKENT